MSTRVHLQESRAWPEQSLDGIVASSGTQRRQSAQHPRKPSEPLKDWEDERSRGDFFETYWRLIYSTARKGGLSDAESQEVVQETVIAVAKQMKEFKYDPARGSFKSWLKLVTRRRIADQYRKRMPLEVGLADVGTYFETLPGNRRVTVERRWHESEVSANPDWPIRSISPRNALAFCAWLTAQEHATGVLPTNYCYRLSRDHEWSWAAGLTNETGTTALQRFATTNWAGRYFWGTNWPPPPGSGNFSGSESVLQPRYRIAGFRDEYQTVSPVGSFPAEINGLFDMAGNVSEICQEWPQAPGVERGFATFLSGPANESAQALAGYTVTVNNAALFSAAPAINNAGLLTFTPATNANGTATVTVVVQDNGGVADGGVDRSTNTFTIVVTAVNDPPVANNDSYTMSQGDALSIAELAPLATGGSGVLANDTDVEGNTLTAIKVTSPSHGTVTLNANGGFIYTPDTNFYGTDSFTYRANDGALDSAPATVNITVLARPAVTPPPGKQRVFSSAALRFSATNAPDINAIRVSDPDSPALTLTLGVTNGTLAITVTNGLTLPNGSTNTNTLVLAGPIASLNAALESLAYTSITNYFGDDTLALVAQDEGGRTNRGRESFSILVEIPARGAALEVPLSGFNNPGLGRMVTNATAVSLDTNLVEGITYDPTNNVVKVLPVGGQDGSTNRSTVTVLARYSDGTTELVTVPVIIYQPLLTSATNQGSYNSTFGTPLFNPQTSLYEQKVSVVNNTPFDFTALRLTATNLPPTVTLQNATLTNAGRVYLDYNLTIAAGSNVTLKVEYFSSDLQPFTPGLKLELLNQQRASTVPTNALMTAVAASRNGYDPDRVAKNYLRFPTRIGQLYYVQYQDVAGPVWKTSPVVITGTGRIYNWIDDGPPSTDTAPGPARFYRVVTDR